MEAGVKRGDFIETAEYSGNLYGTRLDSEYRHHWTVYTGGEIPYTE